MAWVDQGPSLDQYQYKIMEGEVVEQKKETVVVLGGDGYCGWATSLHLSKLGYQIIIIDNFERRRFDESMGTAPLIPIFNLVDRVSAWYELTGEKIEIHPYDIMDDDVLFNVLNDYQPKAVVHFAEQRSAPVSMIDETWAINTQGANISGTLRLIYAVHRASPNTQIVKLGTMGEYGTPNIDIEEGWLDIEHKGRKDRVMYPKKAGSWYHLSKVHDSNNLEFACRMWDLSVTDLNQGIVYGWHTEETRMDKRLINRFDYDQYYGTALNRFVVQALNNNEITVYGAGTQVRSFINIQNTVECIALAIATPALPGEFRVFNQFTEHLSINDVAEFVDDNMHALFPNDYDTKIVHIDNPRIEAESHYYNAVHTGLKELGLNEMLLRGEFVTRLVRELMKHKDEIVVDESTLRPTVKWGA